MYCTDVEGLKRQMMQEIIIKQRADFIKKNKSVNDLQGIKNNKHTFFKHAKSYGSIIELSEIKLKKD